jgi:hypothetical protein
MPKNKRDFEVEIEATVRVAAFDEDSARKKIGKALAAGRALGPDVVSAGKVFTYSTTPVEESN